MDYINSGSMLLNLALTGKPFDGWPLGRISNIIGDRSSGKTLLCVEAATLFLNNPPKDIDPNVVYFESEAAFDMEHAASLGLPVGDVSFETGETIEEFYEVITRVCKESKKGQGTLFILDSLDALSSVAELETDIDSNSYGMSKQKKLGEIFRKITRHLQESNVHLVVVSQIRENITAIPFAPKWRRSGGKALDFYATHIVWLQEVAKLKSLEMIYGIEIRAKVSKNKIARPLRQIDFPIIFEYGIDNTYSMIKFLSSKNVAAKYRVEKQKGGYYTWDGQKYRMEPLINYLEDHQSEYKKLVGLVAEAWNDLEDRVTVSRKSKTELLSGF